MSAEVLELSAITIALCSVDLENFVWPTRSVDERRRGRRAIDNDELRATMVADTRVFELKGNLIKVFQLLLEFEGDLKAKKARQIHDTRSRSVLLSALLLRTRLEQLTRWYCDVHR
ncbi:hypothetical protein KIN20_002249 [Parelaphostrongylus tenuis]|uniref:Uncharacterized protein n=1 Tax=Parelaphostrongylus tenuis TaxID=148309 RepID=A0AAD5QDF0_PARTN|nr:hypothetical protein KIN20_002249 [Parelaphostrongylus tenuis]